MNALLSLLIPGLGQACQGRKGAAATHFVLACLFWVIALGWVVHLASAFGAACWRERQ